MKQKTTNELIAEIYQLNKADTFPFPYSDCRKLMRQAGDGFAGLIPNLNTYFMDISGYASWGHKILKWPKKKVQEARERLRVTFFKKHPEYKLIESMITEDNTPDLYANFLLYEKMRSCLLQIFSQVSDDNGSDTF